MDTWAEEVENYQRKPGETAYKGMNYT